MRDNNYLVFWYIFAAGEFIKTAEYVTADGVFGTLPDLPVATAYFSAVGLNKDEILLLARRVVRRQSQ